METSTSQTKENIADFFRLHGIPDQSHLVNGIGYYLSEIGYIDKRLREAESTFYTIIYIPEGNSAGATSSYNPGGIRNTLRMLDELNERCIELEKLIPISFGDYDMLLQTGVEGRTAAASALVQCAKNNLRYRIDSLGAVVQRANDEMKATKTLIKPSPQ